MRSLLFAFRPIANDLAASLVLVALIALHASPAVATLVSLGLGLAHLVFLKATAPAVAPLQWASLGLVAVMGALSASLQDVRFLMAKSTVVELVIAGVMLQRGWMLRYLPPAGAGRAEDLMIAWGYVWAAAMALLAAANLAVAIWAPGRWAAFKATVPTLLPLVLFAIQYGSTRWLVRRRIRAGWPAAQPEGA